MHRWFEVSLRGGSDAYFNFNCGGVSRRRNARASSGPEVWRECSDLPAQVLLEWRRQLRLQLHHDGTVLRHGIGPPRYLRHQSLCECECTEEGTKLSSAASHLLSRTLRANSLRWSWRPDKR